MRLVLHDPDHAGHDSVHDPDHAGHDSGVKAGACRPWGHDQIQFVFQMDGAIKKTLLADRHLTV